MVLAFGAALALAGAAQAAETAKLADTRWSLTEFGGETFAPAPKPGTHVIFRANGKLSGYAFCNSMFSSYEDAGGKLTIKPIGTTMRACVEAADNAREQAFLKALREVRGYAIDGDRLALLDGKGATVARFAAAAE